MPLRMTRGAARAAGMATLGAAGAALALAGINRLVARTAPTAEPPLGLPPQRFTWTGGDISYTVAGQGPALILLHGIYAGASSFEFRRVFARLARRFRVFAPDLPGFGLSDHSAREYRPDLYIECIHDFAQHVAGSADHPVILLASSLTSAYAIEAAATRPELYERLILIEPAGMITLANQPAAGQRLLGAALRAPLLGDTLYHLLVSRAGLRYFLANQVYLRREEVTDDLIDAYYALSHQRGARYAAASFIGGALNLSIAETFESLTLPILLCWGKAARFTPLETAEAFLERNERVELAIFDQSAGLPQDETPEEFVEQVLAWLGAGLSSRR